MTIGYDVLKILTVEVALGGGRIGVSPSASSPAYHPRHFSALFSTAFTKPGLAVWNALRQDASRSPSRKRKIVTDEIYGGPGPVLAFLTLDQRQSSASSNPTTMSSILGIARTDERPPWVDRYFYARPQFGNIGAPDYTSERGTLPVYMSRELAVGLESMARVLSQSREAEAEEEALG